MTTSVMPPLHRASNLVKTALLLAAMSALTLGVGQLIGGPRGLAYAGAIVVIMNALSFWFADSIALRLNGARQIERHQAPELFDTIEQLARRADLPMPRVYVVETDTPNAFATGRSPAKAAVAVTTGLLETMRPRELEGVLAHELSHVKNRDTLIMTVAATLAGLISQAAQLVFWYGGALLGGGSHREDENRGGGLAMIGLLIVAPLTATLLQLAISRSREFDADASAAELTGDPQGLASALSRLEGLNQALPYDRSPASAHLFIVNPLSRKGVASLFSTHPPLSERIDRLLGRA